MVETIEERVARIEGVLGIGVDNRVLTRRFEYCAVIFIIAGIAASYYGMGLPNHYYQVLFALLCIGLAYHRDWLIFSGSFGSYLLVLGNTFILSTYMKVFLGAGIVQPFAWVRLPDVSSANAEGVSKLLPQLSFQWREVSLSSTAIDLTVIQTFLLLISLIGGLFSFQPFASLTAFFLVVISIPALLQFNWDWVLPALIIGVVGLYLQSGKRTSSTYVSQVDITSAT